MSASADVPLRSTRRIYQHFNDIPNRAEMDRIGRLVEAARQKVLDDPAELTDDDFAALECAGDRGEAAAARVTSDKARLALYKRQVQEHKPQAPAAKSISYEEKLADVIADAIRFATDPLVKPIAALEARPTTGGVKWCGVFRQGERYAEVGTLTTHKGSLWLLTAAAANGDPPGVDPSWRLVVKRGAYRSEDDR